MTKIKHLNWDEGLDMCPRQAKNMLGSIEAACYIDVSIRQLYRLTSTKRIPFYNPTGGRLYFKRKELDHWMLSGRYVTVPFNPVNYLTDVEPPF